MKKSFPILPTITALVAAAYFLVPLFATFYFSLKMTRGTLSFASYGSVFQSQEFLQTLGYSTLASLAAIVMGAVIIVPTAYWVRLKLPKLRPVCASESSTRCVGRRGWRPGDLRGAAMTGSVSRHAIDWQRAIPGERIDDAAVADDRQSIDTTFVRDVDDQE